MINLIRGYKSFYMNRRSGSREKVQKSNSSSHVRGDSKPKRSKSKDHSPSRHSKRSKRRGESESDSEEDYNQKIIIPVTETFGYKYANGILMFVIEVVCILCMIIGCEFSEFSDPKEARGSSEEAKELIQTNYVLFKDVHVMIFLGFGFLMVYLRSNSWSSAGYCFLHSAIACQVYICSRLIVDPMIAGHTGKLQVNLGLITSGDFAAGAVMITYGGLLGKVSPFQMTIVTVIEVLLYTLNEIIGYEKLEVFDTGGSMIIHSFGAIFGVCCTWKLSHRGSSDGKENSSSYVTNLVALIGTLFLWMNWPSFNSVLAYNDKAMHRVMVVTTLSLIASCITTFALSSFFHKGKFDMEHILNATLAGGVIIGSCADILVRPYWALMFGMLGGAISTLGFTYISPLVQKRIGLHDTAGILNLHGIPGIVGGILSCVFIAGLNKELLGDVDPEDVFHHRSTSEQALYQLYTLIITLIFAVVGGFATGFLLSLRFFYPIPKEDMFDDKLYWEEAESPFETLAILVEEKIEEKKEKEKGRADTETKIISPEKKRSPKGNKRPKESSSEDETRDRKDKKWYKEGKGKKEKGKKGKEESSSEDESKKDRWYQGKGKKRSRSKRRDDSDEES